MPDNKTIINEITRFYLDSHDFNGIPISELLSKCSISKTNLISKLAELIKEHKTSVVFGDYHPNPHVRAFPDDPIKEGQVEKLQTDLFNHACVYPLPKHLKEVVDKTKYNDSPFTLMLALGEPQLEFRAFDLSVLEHYRNDPRYSYHTDGIYGRLSIANEYYESSEFPERDKILLQTFGFCYDSEMNRAVAVFIRYLSNLSPEHQRIWHAKMLDGDYRLHPDYYRSSIQGLFGEKISIFTAFFEELRVINEMCELMNRPYLFRNDFSKTEKPRDFCFLVRPTLKEYNNFVHLLDKMISENINVDFFQNEVEYETEIVRKDSKVEVQKKGSLRIMEDWFIKHFEVTNQSLLDEMFATFKEIRRKRQKPAHRVNEDDFDMKYFHDQRDLIRKGHRAIRILRTAFDLHPLVKSSDYKINDLVEKGEIWDF